MRAVTSGCSQVGGVAGARDQGEGGVGQRIGPWRRRWRRSAGRRLRPPPGSASPVAECRPTASAGSRRRPGAGWRPARPACSAAARPPRRPPRQVGEHGGGQPAIEEPGHVAGPVQLVGHGVVAPAALGPGRVVLDAGGGPDEHQPAHGRRAAPGRRAGRNGRPREYPSRSKGSSPAHRRQQPAATGREVGDARPRTRRGRAGRRGPTDGWPASGRRTAPRAARSG